MRRYMTLDQTADGGYPIARDLCKMTDDGCPLVSSLLSDQDKRENVASAQPWQTKTRWQRLGEEIELRDLWRGLCERMVQSDRRDV